MTAPTVTHNVAIKLRAVAAWLESHPEFEPHYLDIDGDTATARMHGLDAERMTQIATAISGQWEPGFGGTADSLAKLSQEIAPDVVVELIGARDNVCTPRVEDGQVVWTLPEIATARERERV